MFIGGLPLLEYTCAVVFTRNATLPESYLTSENLNTVADYLTIHDNDAVHFIKWRRSNRIAYIFLERDI